MAQNEKELGAKYRHMYIALSKINVPYLLTIRTEQLARIKIKIDSFNKIFAATAVFWDCGETPENLEIKMDELYREIRTDINNALFPNHAAVTD